MKIINLNDAAGRVELDGLPVHGAPATGLSLHTNGHLGADILHVPAGERFAVHTHPGDHLLLCLIGTGTISVAEKTYDVRPGDFYMVDGMTPHAVGAGPSDHILVAIGSPHKPVDSPERMAFTDWEGNTLESPMFADAAAEPRIILKPSGEWTARELGDLAEALEQMAAERPSHITRTPGPKA